MRPQQIGLDHEAVRQNFRLKLRVSELYPHLGRLVVTDETGIDGDICCADLGQVVTASIKEEASDLGLVLEAEVLANYRTGLRSDQSARLKQSEMSVVSRAASEMQEKIEDD